MYKFTRTSKFKKDYKRSQKQHKNLEKFMNIHLLLIVGKSLPTKNKDHNLSGNWSGFRECHIEPDWLLIYRVDEKEQFIEYVRMGSHSELFS